MRIRPATKTDHPELATVLELAVADIESHGGDPGRSSLAFATGFGIQTGQPVVVAEQEEPRAIVGLCIWARHPESRAPEGEIRELATWVTPVHRRKGVSRDMRELAAQHARALGYRSVVTSVAAKNVTAVDASRKAGFKISALEMRRGL